MPVGLGVELRVCFFLRCEARSGGGDRESKKSERGERKKEL